ncbi:hypothetical protein KC959_00070 [Candidatus Saccharibacteria bacterium]|nr:hypothetical protein [Candidatus Saccharibacteria bacterium]
MGDKKRGKGSRSQLRGRDAVTARIISQAPEHLRTDLLGVLPGRSKSRQLRIAEIAGVAIPAPEVTSRKGAVAADTTPADVPSGRTRYVPLQHLGPRTVTPDNVVYPRPLGVEGDQVWVELEPGVSYVGSSIGFASIHLALTDQVPDEPGSHPGYL